MSQRWSRIQESILGRYEILTFGCDCCSDTKRHPPPDELYEPVTLADADELIESLEEQLAMARALRAELAAAQGGPDSGAGHGGEPGHE